MKKLKKITIFIGLFLIFLFSSLFYIIPLEILNIDYSSLNSSMKVLLSIGSSLIIILILVIIYHKDLKEMLSDYKKNYNEYFDLGLKCWFVGLVIMCLSNILISMLTPVHEANNEVLVQNMLKASPFLSFISSSLLAPFIEEMIFRKSLGDIFDNKYFKIIMSALIFGLLHVIFSFNTWYDFLYVIPYGALGGAFSYILTKKNNIFIPITFHVLHNSIITIISIIGYLV